MASRAVLTVPLPVAASPVEATETRRLLVLDGFRGLAAVIVVLYHVGTARGISWLAPRGYLAVDFFFVLSGFVLARAYEVRLQSGQLSPFAFYRLRLRRLWPMAAAGTLLGAALLGSRSWSTLVAFAFGAAMLPDLIPGASAFPLNAPHWSIFLELAANYVYAIVAPRLTRRALIVGVVASGVWLAVDTMRAGDANHIDPARVAFGFFVGIALYRAWRDGIRATSPSGPLVGLALAACLLVPSLPGIGVAASDVLAELVIFPLLVWLGASAKVSGSAAEACRIAGDASYPLYALHYPILVSLLG